MGIVDTFKELMNGSGPPSNDANLLKGSIEELLKYDVGRSAYFKVEILNSPFFSIDNKYLEYLCHSAELPGESTATVSQKIYGITEKFSVMSGYNDIQLAFYTRGSGVEGSRKFFQNWLAFITGRGETINYPGYTRNETTYNVKYKSEYVATIKITHYAITGDPLMEVTLYDAFPIAINQIPLSWSAQNQAHSLNVVFAYTEYQYDLKYVDGNKKYTRGALGQLMNTAMGTASAINTIQGAIKTGNPSWALSAMPSLGMSNFTINKG